MKKSSILILIAICLFSCSKPSKEASSTGEIKGVGTDTLYLYGMDELRDRIDTSRAVSPLRKAADARELANSHMTLSEQKEWLAARFRKVVGAE